MKTMNTGNRTMKRLAAALTLCVAPAMALADDRMKDMGAEAREAYREGQIWATYVGNESLQSYDIDVDVDGSRAVLTGTVDSEVEKQLAERIANRVDGIDRVDNQLRVDENWMANNHRNTRTTATTAAVDEPDFGDYVGDKTAEAMVKSKLLWNTVTDGTDIDVEVLNNVATLSGVADSETSKRAAERVALDTRGVRSVNNNLRVASEGVAGVGDNTTMGDRATTNPASADRNDREFARTTEQGQQREYAGLTGDRDNSDSRAVRTGSEAGMSDEWIEARVNSTLMWTNGIDGGDIDVEVDNGVVTLEGEVESEWAKNRAQEIAQDIRGVNRVDVNELEVQDYGDRISQR